MAYKVNFTETTNPAKPPINVEDQTLNTTKSVSFPGKNYPGYATVIAENFLHLLENFSSVTSPTNPVQGQLWYDNTPNASLLKVYDGTTWVSAGAITKKGTRPLNPTLGDLWIDTSNQQLYIWSGSNWLLVGPQYSAGSKTGPVVETIIDTNNVSHSVISFYSNDERISIQSYTAFTPKAAIAGFASVNRGVTLNSLSNTENNTTSLSKFWGTASVADSLNYNGTTVSATNFLRGDIESVTNKLFSVRNNAGINIGSDLGFNIGTDSTSAILYSLRSGSSIDFKVNNSGSPTIAIHISSTGKVGIGPDSTSPQESLDVNGSIVSNGKIYTTSTTNSTALGIGSITTAGGLSVAKDSNFGGSLTVSGNINLNNVDTNGDPIGGEVIVPNYTSDSQEALDLSIPLESSPLYDIGTETRKFRNVYAETFTGNFTGTFTTSSTINGSVSGSASRLASPTTFRIGDSLDPLVEKSDVVSNVISFDGQGDDPVIFTATVTQDFIKNKTETFESSNTDLMLIYRQGTNGGLRQTSKSTFLKNVATVPVGSILPFAGPVAPAGYLLCDGSEILRNDYLELFSVIQFTYKPSSQLQGIGTFALPDLRGRFPLGRDNMDNGTKIPVTGTTEEGGQLLVDAGGGSANRVTDITADTLGAGGGSEGTTLSVSNLPDHRHNLNSGYQQYYAAGLPAGGVDPNAVPNLGMPNTSTGTGLPNSGGVQSATLGESFITMNPYLAINYIIFTGKL
jgi:microcystin-dependent protein